GFFLPGRNGAARGPAVLQGGDQRFHHRDRGDVFLVAAAGALLRLGQPLLQAFQVGEHQLGFHHVRVAQRIDGAFHVGNVAVLETAQNVDDGVHFADIGQELVAKALTLRSATHQTGDSDELERCRHDFRRFADSREHVQTFVGHRDAANIRLDGAERVIGRLRRGGGRQGVEQRRFPDVGQPDDAAVEAHLYLSPGTPNPHHVTPDHTAPSAIRRALGYGILAEERYATSIRACWPAAAARRRSRVSSRASSASASATYTASQAVRLSRSSHTRGKRKPCGYRRSGKSARSISASRPRFWSISPDVAYRRITCVTSTSSRWGACSVSWVSNNRFSTAPAAGVRSNISMSAEASTTITGCRARREQPELVPATASRPIGSADGFATPPGSAVRRLREARSAGNRTVTCPPARRATCGGDAARREHGGVGASPAREVEKNMC